jgi:hypothetical protein
MDSDEDEIYTKIIAFNKIYNFVVQTFPFEVNLRTQKIEMRSPDLNLRYPDLDGILTF